MGWLSKAKKAASKAMSNVVDTATSAATTVQNVIPEEVRNSRVGQVASYGGKMATEAAAISYGSAGVLALGLARSGGDPRKAVDESKRIVLDRVDTARKVISGDYAGLGAKVSANTGGSQKEQAMISKAGSYYDTANKAVAAGQQVYSGDFQGALDTAKTAGGKVGQAANAVQTGVDVAGKLGSVDPATLGAEGISRASTFASNQISRAQNMGVSAIGMIGKGPGFLAGTPLAGLGASNIVNMIGTTKSALGFGSPGSSAVRAANQAANQAARAGADPAPVTIKKVSFTRKIVDWFYT